MAVEVTCAGFGPIAEGTIALHPLTVLIGPNNSGKSYCAAALYAAHGAVPVRWSMIDLPPVRRWRRASRRNWRASPSSPEPSVLQALVEYLRDLLARAGDRPCPSPVREHLERERVALLKEYGLEVARELERAFGTQLEKLARHPRTGQPATITVRDTDQGWAVTVPLASAEPEVVPPGTEVLPREVVEQGSRTFEWLSSGARSRSAAGERAASRVETELLLENLLEAIADRTFSGFATGCFYLPAARSGFLQSHKLVASALVSNATLFGIEDLAVPKLSGVIGDFIRLLLTIDSRRRIDSKETRRLAGVAEFIEEQLLHGKVAISGHPPEYPEISFVQDGLDLGLPRTSSMVSELAPVVLVTRHLLRPGALVILEEPEAHLHPAAQRVMARAIARLVVGEARVTITTHSDYLLTQLNNLIMAHALPTEARAERGVDLGETLSAAAVGAYLFEVDGPTGTRVRRLEVTERDGVPQATFEEVAAALYRQSLDLERGLPPDAE